MKITNKKLLIPFSIVATALVSSGIAYAVTSLNFSNQASLWATKNCTSALSTSAATATNEQKSIICYSYNKTKEQDASIYGIQSSIARLNTNNTVLSNNIQNQGNDVASLQNKKAKLLTNINNYGSSKSNIIDTNGYSLMLISVNFSLGVYGDKFCVGILSSPDKVTWTSRESSCGNNVDGQTLSVYVHDRYYATSSSNDAYASQAILY